MKLLKPFLIFIQFLCVILLLSRDARAMNPSCAELLHPLESKVDAIQGQGGIWGNFDKFYKVRNHATVTLKLDSKVMFLIVSLNHLCKTQNGIPFDVIARMIVPMLKEKGEQLFLEEMFNFGHSPEEVEKLVEYAKFAENNLNRKLDINQIMKTMEESHPYIDRLVALSDKIGKVEPDSILNEAKSLIDDIEKFRATNPYLKQADYENSQVPHARFITSNSDAM